MGRTAYHPKANRGFRRRWRQPRRIRLTLSKTAVIDPPSEGAAAIALEVAIAAAGKRNPKGVAAVGLKVAIAAAGKRNPKGAAAVGLKVAIASAGKRVAKGSAAIALELAIAASGKRIAKGVAAVGLECLIAAAGKRHPKGSAAVGLELIIGAAGDAPGSIDPAYGATNLGLRIAITADGYAPIIVTPSEFVDLLDIGAAWLASQRHANLDTLLSAGATWHSATRHNFMTQTVTYRRGTDTAFTLQATLGRTEWQASPANPTIETWESRDYIVRAVDMTFNGQLMQPRRGDTIQESVGGVVYTYEVLSPVGTTPWRFCDAYRRDLRIHTKNIKTE